MKLQAHLQPVLHRALRQAGGKAVQAHRHGQGLLSQTPAREANEGAIKLARKYSFDHYGMGRMFDNHPPATPSMAAPLLPWRPPVRTCSTTTFSPSPRASAMPPPVTSGRPSRALADRHYLRRYAGADPGRGRRAAPGPGVYRRLAALCEEKDLPAPCGRGADRRGPDGQPVLVCRAVRAPARMW